MDRLYEQSGILCEPVEAFVFDSRREQFPVRSHWHYFMELIYTLEGSVLAVAGETAYRLSPGELVLFHPKTVHSIEAADGSEPVYMVIKFDVGRLRASADYAPTLRDIFLAAQGDPCAPVVLPSDSCAAIGARALMEDCVAEAVGRGYGYSTALDANLYILLTRIMRLWMAKGFDVRQAIGRTQGESPIYALSEYIDAHSADELRVGELAAMCGMSYSHFERCFKSIYRQSCKRFISRVRINKAADLLLFTDADLNTISQGTGFSDCSHFIRTFRELRGVTPGQYRTGRRAAEH